MTSHSPLRAPARSAPPALAAGPRGHAGTPASAVEVRERFVAYAAHELRGSIALQRTLAQVALADADADRVALREMGERVIAACERQERLLEACLALVRSRGAPRRREPVDLAAIAAAVLRAHDRDGLRASAALGPARAAGDPHLLERLVANLVANAVRHNVLGGRFDLVTHTAAGRAVFAIANTGPVIPAGDCPASSSRSSDSTKAPGHPATASGSASPSSARSPTPTRRPSRPLPAPAAAFGSTWRSPLSTERRSPT